MHQSQSQSVQSHRASPPNIPVVTRLMCRSHLANATGTSPMRSLALAATRAVHKRAHTLSSHTKSHSSAASPAHDSEERSRAAWAKQDSTRPGCLLRTTGTHQPAIQNDPGTSAVRQDDESGCIVGSVGGRREAENMTVSRRRRRDGTPARQSSRMRVNEGDGMGNP